MYQVVIITKYENYKKSHKKIKCLCFHVVLVLSFLSMAVPELVYQDWFFLAQNFSDKNRQLEQCIQFHVCFAQIV